MINEAVYGPEHPEVAITLTNLGVVQRDLGELEPARSALRRALAIYKRFLGPGHAHTVQARSILERIGPSASGGPK